MQLRFWLSEPATVVDRARAQGSRTVVRRSATVQAPAGTRSVRAAQQARSRGHATRVELRAADAMGNKGAAATKTLRVK